MAEAFFQPISGMDLPRFAGIPTFMRLPHVPAGHPREKDVQIGLVGLPWDGGVTNRPGPRHGPRQLRDYSTMIRAQHSVTNLRPFEAANCADLGDVGPNPVDNPDTLARFERYFTDLKARGIRPLSAGGDHLCTLPVLRGIAREAPLGLVHFDSHTDLYPAYFGGTTLTHGNPFRSAVEEGLLDPARMIQIGIRGTMYDSDDRDFAKAHGIRIVTIEEFFDRGVPDVMAEAREIVGPGPHTCPMTSTSSIRRSRRERERPNGAGRTPFRRSRSCANVRASTSSAPTSSRSRRPTTRPAAPLGWARR